MAVDFGHERILVAKGRTLGNNQVGRDRALYSFFHWLFPMFHVKFSGIEFILNRKFSGAMRELFVFKLWDIEMLGLSYDYGNALQASRDSERFHITLLGICLTITPNLPSHWVAVQYDRKIWAVLLSIATFALLMTMANIPSVVVLMVPIWGVSMAEMSFTAWLLSYRAYVACIEVIAGLESALYTFMTEINDKPDPMSAYFKNALSYRIWLDFLVFPAAVFGYEVLTFVMISTTVISLLDVLFSEEAMMVFQWNVLKLSMVLFGYLGIADHPEATVTKTQFSVFAFDLLRCFSMDIRGFTPSEYDGCVSLWCSSYKQHLELRAMGIDKEKGSVMRQFTDMDDQPGVAL